MNIHELLAQKKVWIDGKKEVHRLGSMDPDHRLNVLMFLERKARPLKLSAELRFLMDPQVTADNPDFEERVRILFAASPEEWLSSQPLIKKLRKLQRRHEKWMKTVIAEHQAAQYRLWDTEALNAFVGDRSDRTGRWTGDRY